MKNVKTTKEKIMVLDVDDVVNDAIDQEENWLPEFDYEEMKVMENLGKDAQKVFIEENIDEFFNQYGKDFDRDMINEKRDEIVSKIVDNLFT